MRAAKQRSTSAEPDQDGGHHGQDREAAPKDKAALEAPPVQQKIRFERQ
jgi:hypothetical protein